MAATVNDVLRIAPEFSDVFVGDIEAFLADAATHVNQAAWGAKYDQAVTLYAAHLLAVTYPNKTARQVASESIQGVSRSLDTPSSLAGEGYDRFHSEFVRMMRLLGCGFSAT